MPAAEHVHLWFPGGPCTLGFVLTKLLEKGLCYKWVLTGGNHEAQVCVGKGDVSPTQSPCTHNAVFP